MRPSALVRTTFLASVAVFGLPLFSGAASASHSTPRCPVGGHRVVAVRSPRIVVTRVTFDRRATPAQRFWCAEWLPSGRTTVLATGEGPTTLTACVSFDTCAFAAQVTVAGRYVAYIYREPDQHYDDGIDSISEFNARDGTMVVKSVNDLSLYASESRGGGIIKLVLNTRGDVAWIVDNPVDPAPAGSSAVYEHRPGQRTLVLDTASLGAISRLAITATTITWIDDGVPHSISS